MTFILLLVFYFFGKCLQIFEFSPIYSTATVTTVVTGLSLNQFCRAFRMPFSACNYDLGVGEGTP